MKTKQIIYTALIFIFSVNLIGAQEKVTIPEMTDAQKHKRVYFILNYSLIVGASYAKTQGQTIEDFAKHFGEMSKTTWNPKAGFNGFIRGTVYNWESWRPSSCEAIVIQKQTDSIFQFKVPLEIKKMLGDKSYHNISFLELMSMYEILHKVIAKHLDVSYEQKIIENGNWIEITITK